MGRGGAGLGGLAQLDAAPLPPHAVSSPRQVTGEERLAVKLQPRQSTAYFTPATEVLYGGAAFGGKSHLLRQGSILDSLLIPGLQSYIFRRVRDDLMKNHVEGPAGFNALAGQSEGLFQVVGDEIRFANKSKVFLAHCKDDKDRFKYQGAEIHVLNMDELTHFTEVVYRFLRSRVRMVGLRGPALLPGPYPRIRCGSNPGNIGHHWVKRTFIDGVTPFALRQMPKDEGGMLRQYIPARMKDNAIGMKQNPDYEQQLSGLGDPALVAAMKDGDWNVVAGAFFHEFLTARHVIPALPIPAHWPRFRACDWGSAEPFSVGWYAVSDGCEEWAAPGCIVRYREWYGMEDGRPNVGLRLDAEELGAGIVKRTPRTETIRYGVLDPRAFARDGGPSIAEQMAKAGAFFRRADNARVQRAGSVGGWDQVRRRLKGDAEGRPLALIFENGLNLIRTLPALQHSEDNAEDVREGAEDHAPDEFRYACMSRPPIARVEPERHSVGVVIGGASTMTYADLQALRPAPARRGRL